MRISPNGTAVGNFSRDGGVLGPFQFVKVGDFI